MPPTSDVRFRYMFVNIHEFQNLPLDYSSFNHYQFLVTLDSDNILPDSFIFDSKKLFDKLGHLDYKK